MSSSGRRIGPKCKTTYREKGKGIVSVPGNSSILKAKKPLQGQLYTVEKILGKKLEGRVTKYLIKWENWPSSDNTWEPESHIPKYMIREFEKETSKGEVSNLEQGKGESNSDIENIDITLKEKNEQTHLISFASTEELELKGVQSIETVTYKPRTNDPNGVPNLTFIVRLENIEGLRAVSSEDAYALFPAKVIQYFESIINFS